jgi:flagellar hook-basal body complex protein FliE
MRGDTAMKEFLVTNLSATTPPRTLAPTPLPSQGGNFLTYLQQAVGEVNTLQQTAGQEVTQLVGEGKGDLQETVIAMEKADISFRLMMQIRNKVLDAYQEIIRMQV